VVAVSLACSTVSAGGGTICGTADEGSSAVLSCPPGNVITSIDFASYGTPTGECGAFQYGAYHAPTSLSVVRQECLGHRVCSVPATNARFGGRGGVGRRLCIQASYRPGDGICDSVRVCATAPEASAARLDVPAGYLVASIRFASYGTPDGACGNYSISSCHAPASGAVVEAACLGAPGCTVLADNDIFQSDPCPEIAKRLYIEATAASAHWASWASLKVIHR
jgi:hypothetical protein